MYKYIEYAKLPLYNYMNMYHIVPCASWAQFSLDNVHKGGSKTIIISYINVYLIRSSAGNHRVSHPGKGLREYLRQNG